MQIFVRQVLASAAISNNRYPSAELRSRFAALSQSGAPTHARDCLFPPGPQAPAFLRSAGRPRRAG
eukprot:5595384-Pyramimonas_sp.AAC.1